jgi:hypothetical protein
VFNQKKDSQCITSSTLSRKGGLHERLYPW